MHVPLVPLIDGRRGEVFAAVYAANGDGGVRVVEPVAIVPADALAAWLVRLGDVLVGGDGALLYRELLPVTAHAAAGMPAPTAAMVGAAVACAAPGVVVGPDDVLPLYGRAPDAARWAGAGAAPGARAGGAP